MANPTSYLTRAASGGNQKTYTISVWVRLGNTHTPVTNGAANRVIVGSDISANAQNHATLSMDNEFRLKFMNLTSNDWGTNLKPDRLLLDGTSWYHIVARVDTTQATASDRVRLYINGELQTQFATSIYPDQNEDTSMFNYQTLIGARKSSSPDGFWLGHMGHLHICEGQSYAASKFGETDSTTGEWKPTLNPSSVSYGDNGCFLKFEDSSNLGLDSSGQGHNFTVVGDLKQSISTPSNTFATFSFTHHAIDQQNKISRAGTQIDHANDSYTSKITCATLGMNKGKWYWETKYSTTGGYLNVGFVRNGGLDATRNIRQNGDLGDGDDANSWAFQAGNSSGQIQKKIRHNNADAVADMGVTPAVNDIIQCWLDLDNGKAWWGINGTVMNSGSGTGVPNSGTYPHVTFTVGDEFYIPAISLFGFNGAPQCQVNFGEGRFGTTAVSSAVADNGGNGSFEYSPLSGFYSICTKNIKDYG